MGWEWKRRGFGVHDSAPVEIRAKPPDSAGVSGVDRGPEARRTSTRIHEVTAKIHY